MELGRGVFARARPWPWCRAAMQQTLDADVLVDDGPMHSLPGDGRPAAAQGCRAARTGATFGKPEAADAKLILAGSGAIRG